jgi:putative MFS transporter
MQLVFTRVPDVLSVWCTVIFAGLLVGNLTGGFVGDAFGRRAGLIGMAVLFCVAGTCSAAAPDIYTFAIARFLTGIGVGGMIPVADSHLLEWSSGPWRARLAMSLVGCAFAVGTLIACGVGIAVHEYMSVENKAWWRIMLLICIIPGFISVPAIIFLLPESMHWLLVRGRYEEVRVLLVELNKANETELLANGTVSVTKVNPVDEGDSSVEDQPLLNWKFLEIFGSELIGTTAYLSVVFTACGFIYYGHIFIYPRLLEILFNLQMKEAFTAVMINSCVEIVVMVAMMFYMDIQYIGRRGAMITGFAFVSVTALFAMIEQQDEDEFKFFNAIMRAMVAGPFIVVYIYAGELLPSTLRSSTISFCNSFGRLAAMIAPVILTREIHMNINLIYYTFSLVGLMATIASILHYRETLGRPLLLYTSQLKEQRESDETTPLMTRYVPFMGGW